MFDPYSQGAAFLETEARCVLWQVSWPSPGSPIDSSGVHMQVKELFELDPQLDVAPSPPEALLTGLLTELCRLHWCK